MSEWSIYTLQRSVQMFVVSIHTPKSGMYWFEQGIQTSLFLLLMSCTALTYLNF
jgi:hypothetical protein